VTAAVPAGSARLLEGGPIATEIRAAVAEDVASFTTIGALTSGGKLMGIQSGIPFDLLVFIMALVIMFVAAPNLIRSIWHLGSGKPKPEEAPPNIPPATHPSAPI
jgi:simple sugar transport system permease protein